MSRRVLLCPALLLSLIVAAGCQQDPVGPGIDPGGDAGLEPDAASVAIDAAVIDDAAVPVDAAVPIDAAPPPPPPPAWAELAGPIVSVEGGSALGPIGQATAGGLVRISARGAITIDPALPAVAPPPIPALPAGGTPLTSADLGADVTRAGTLRVGGEITSGGLDPVRTITSTDGDLIVDGTLRSADLGAARQALVLRAPGGTVFITGTVDTSGEDGLHDGNAGGGLVIEAARVVIGGQLTAAGEQGVLGAAGGTGGDLRVVASAGSIWLGHGTLVTAGGSSMSRGGDAGGIELRATGPLWLAGIIDSFGGDARNVATAEGGRGGPITIVGGSTLDLTSTVRLRGGAATGADATATGGAAGILTIDAVGLTRIGGVVDGRGGIASGGVTGGTVNAGAAGSVRIGDQTRPAAIELTTTAIAARGGDGRGRGGGGGEVELTADGELGLVGAIDVGGGGSDQRPGDAGAVRGTAGPHAGGIRLAGAVRAIGGAATGTGAADGGRGGLARLLVTSTAGDLVITTAGALTLDGGAASGSGRAGAGGDITMRTMDGNASMAGMVDARGGAAPGAGGVGGAGGDLELFTDANFNGVGGNLTIEVAGVIDVSGGPGTIGGSARDDGTGGVALFPIHQDLIAVLLNSDGIHGSPVDGGLVNLGRIVARGGAGNGSGGDIMFHGRQPHHFEDPLPGLLILDGDGTGRPGNFVAE